jgi:hypothetical protein
MSKKQFPLGEDDDEALRKRIDVVAREKGLPSLTPELAKNNEAPEPRPMKPIKLMVPDYLFRELSMNAADRGVTKKYLILKALQAAGYRVEPEDMEEDGRRVR